MHNEEADIGLSIAPAGTPPAEEPVTGEGAALVALKSRASWPFVRQAPGWTST